MNENIEIAFCRTPGPPGTCPSNKSGILRFRPRSIARALAFRDARWKVSIEVGVARGAKPCTYFLGVGMKFRVSTRWATGINRYGKCPVKWIPSSLSPGPPFNGKNCTEEAIRQSVKGQAAGTTGRSRNQSCTRLGKELRALQTYISSSQTEAEEKGANLG